MKLLISALFLILSSHAYAWDYTVDRPGSHELRVKPGSFRIITVRIDPEYAPHEPLWIDESPGFSCRVRSYDRFGRYDRMTIDWKEGSGSGGCELTWWTYSGWHINFEIKKK